MMSKFVGHIKWNRRSRNFKSLKWMWLSRVQTITELPRSILGWQPSRTIRPWFCDSILLTTMFFWSLFCRASWHSSNSFYPRSNYRISHSLNENLLLCVGFRMILMSIPMTISSSMSSGTSCIMAVAGNIVKLDRQFDTWLSICLQLQRTICCTIHLKSIHFKPSRFFAAILFAMSLATPTNPMSPMSTWHIWSY